MVWRIKISAAAKKSLSKLDQQQARRITQFLGNKIALSKNPRSSGKSLSGDLLTFWRYRVGDYRIICDIQDSEITILVVAIGHRSKIYSRR